MLARIHILEGRQLVLLNIDEVIRIIRESDEPKPALIEAFGLSERQADDILDIRLRQLARLEAIKIEQELAEQRDKQKKLEDILSSPAALKRTVIKEIEADAKAHGDDRRTLIQAEKRAVAEVKIVDEPVTVVVSLKGWVRAMKGQGHDAARLRVQVGRRPVRHVRMPHASTRCSCSAATRAARAASTRWPSARCRARAATARPSRR